MLGGFLPVTWLKPQNTAESCWAGPSLLRSRASPTFFIKDKSQFRHRVTSFPGVRRGGLCDAYIRKEPDSESTGPRGRPLSVREPGMCPVGFLQEKASSEPWCPALQPPTHHQSGEWRNLGLRTCSALPWPAALFQHLLEYAGIGPFPGWGWPCVWELCALPAHESLASELPPRTG